MNILDEIIMFKRLEVARRKAEVSLGDLERNPLYQSPRRSLQKSLLSGTNTGIIAEFKRKSPSKGIINDNVGVAGVTGAYTKHGAAGLSVLTDEHFFGGCSGDLMAARGNDIPILRKDFIIDEYQLVEARSIGADVILLIAACLAPAEVKYLAGFARQLELEVLLEIHNGEELAHICEEVDMVGVNNRNLKTFDVSIDTSLRLINKIPTTKPAIAESGISDVQTVVTLRQAGFRGFLIGETFMKEEDPGKAFSGFVSGLKNDFSQRAPRET
jgi:indole-3-glycerol phosphate synthase